MFGHVYVCKHESIDDHGIEVSVANVACLREQCAAPLCLVAPNSRRRLIMCVYSPQDGMRLTVIIDASVPEVQQAEE